MRTTGLVLLCVLAGSFVAPNHARAMTAVSDPSCTIYRAGTDLRVTVRASNAENQCIDAIRRWSSGAAYWTAQPSCQESCSAAPPLVCEMQNSDKYTIVIVRDAGGQYGGRGMCGEFAHSGWHDYTPPRPPAASVSGVSPGDHSITSPSGNLICDLSQSAGPATAQVYCIIVSRMQIATMRGQSGLTTVHHLKSIDLGSSAQVVILSYGRSVSGHGFQCTSLTSGIRCTRIASGAGFVVARGGIRTVS